MYRCFHVGLCKLYLQKGSDLSRVRKKGRKRWSGSSVLKKAYEKEGMEKQGGNTLVKALDKYSSRLFCEFILSPSQSKG